MSSGRFYWMVSHSTVYRSLNADRDFCRCDAYNLGTASACLLCLMFGLSIFFDVKDLHASRASPRTRT